MGRYQAKSPCASGPANPHEYFTVYRSPHSRHWIPTAQPQTPTHTQVLSLPLASAIMVRVGWAFAFCSISSLFRSGRVIGWFNFPERCDSQIPMADPCAKPSAQAGTNYFIFYQLSVVIIVTLHYLMALYDMN